MNTFRSFVSDQSGATAIEYALIAALISIIAVASMKNLGTTISTTFSNVATNMSR